MKLSRKWCLKQANLLSPSLPAGLSPTGAVDRSSGCLAEPARLGLQPQGLRPGALGPALLPAGMQPVGQVWEYLGSALGLLAPGPQSHGRDSLATLGGLCAGALVDQGRPPESLVMGRSTPSTPEAAGAAGRPWSSCCSPSCWANGRDRAVCGSGWATQAALWPQLVSWQHPLPYPQTHHQLQPSLTR